MKRFAVLFPLVLILALPTVGLAARRPSIQKQAHPSTSVRTYRSSRLGLGLGPSSILSTPTTLSDDEQAFVRLVNEERARRHLHQLTIDPVLVAAARQHSDEMNRMRYFDHYSPVRGLRTPLDRYGMSLGSRKFTCTVGENLFYSSVRDINLGHTSLMKSPGHRANILAGDYRYIGVGVVLSDTGEYYVTQMFHT